MWVCVVGIEYMLKMDVGIVLFDDGYVMLVVMVGQGVILVNLLLLCDVLEVGMFVQFFVVFVIQCYVFWVVVLFVCFEDVVVCVVWDWLCVCCESMVCVYCLV